MLHSPYKIKHYYPSKVFIPYDNYWNGEYIDPRDLTENRGITNGSLPNFFLHKR